MKNSDYLDYSLRPIVVSAKEAHQKGFVKYHPNGTVSFSHPELKSKTSLTKIEITPDHQFPAIFATYADLNKSLSSLANSPLLKGKQSLRDLFDKEFRDYQNLILQTQQEKLWEPDYGTYVFDHLMGNLYLIAPEFWHRLGLVTNTAKLITDPTKKLSWFDIRQKFDDAVIGVVGASVGGNVIEGIMREVRPRRVKIADLDWEEITNLNRLERGSIRHLVASRSKRQDIKNHFELNRVNKADLAAYEHHMVDPYAQFYVYNEGVNSDNIERFILGGDGEPKIDLFVEEMDNFSMKYEVRKLCRKYHIPVLMLSDFGHRVQIQLQDFRTYPNLELGYQISDQDLEKCLNKAMTTGNREDVFEFVRALCGADFAADEFADWIKGEGEQPTSSLPQSGATALNSGGIGGKIVAWFLLGYNLPEWLVYDFKHHQVLIKKSDKDGRVE